MVIICTPYVVYNMVGLDIDISDVKKLLANKYKNNDKILGEIHREHIKDIAQLSQEFVDVDTGALKESMTYSISNLNNNKIGVVAYNKDYALSVHERPGRRSGGKRRKYLYRATQITYKEKLTLLKERLIKDD